MKQLFLGLVGEPGSGKDTFVSVLTKVVKKHKLTVAMVRFSDALSTICDIFGIPKTRANLQCLAQDLRKYCQAPIATAAKNSALAHGADIVVLNGLRWLEDEEMFRQLSNNVLVYVTADQKVRWTRRRMSKEKLDELTMSFEEFQAKDRAPTETYIPHLGSRADATISNNGGQKIFQREVKNLFHKQLINLLCA